MGEYPADIVPILEAIADRAARLCESQDARILLVEGDVLRYVAGFSEVPFPIDPIRPLTRGLTMGRAVIDRAVVHVEDLAAAGEEFPESYAYQRRLGYHRTALAVPLVSGDKAIGAILLRRGEVRPFDEKHIELVKAFADQAATAIENLRLSAELKSRNVELTEALEQQTATADILRVISSSPTDIQPVLDAVAETAARLCGATDVVIRRADGDVTRVVAHFGPVPVAGDGVRPLTKRTLVGHAIIEARTMQVLDVADPRVCREYPDSVWSSPDGPPVRTVLAAPLLRADTWIGAIVMRREEAKLFSPKQVRLLETFADQAVIAIENVRLFNETKEALEQQTATSEVLRVISGSPTDAQPVFEAILEKAIQLCGGHMGALGLYDGEAFLRVAHRSPNPAFAEWGDRRGRFIPGRTSALGRMRAERKTIHIPDLRESPGYRDRARNTVMLVEVGGVRTLLAVPLLKEGRVVGGITIYRPEVRPFAQKQIDLVTTFANQAVIAIENVRLFKETMEALEQQTATAEILKVISSSPTDTQPVFDAIVKNGAQLFHSKIVSLRLVAGDRAELAASTVPAPSDPIPLTDDRSLTARAILRREVVQTPDVFTEEWVGDRTRQRAERVGYRAVVSAPMLKEGVAIGVINVMREARGPFSEKEVVLLQTFADQAVIAIENVRLFKELQARNAEVTEALEQQTATADILRVISSSPTDTQPVFDVILEHAARLCDAHVACMGLYDGENYRFVAQRGANAEYQRWLADRKPWRPGAVIGQMISEEHAIPVVDLRETPAYRERTSAGIVALVELGGARSSLAVPMLKDGQVLGGITVYRPEVRPFTPKQIDLVSTFTDQAVIAIENVRLFKELQARNVEVNEALEQQTATAEILKVISSSPTDLQPVFEAILEGAARLCDSPLGTIGTYDGEEHQYVAVRAGNADVEKWVRDRGPFRPQPGGFLSKVLESGEPVQITDLRESTGYRDRRPLQTLLVEQIGVRTHLAVPMQKEGRAVGTIALYRTEVRPFTQKQIDLVTTFANQAVIAIENVRLFKALQARNAEVTVALEQQTATADILSVISSSPTNLQPVFDAILENATRLCDAHMANLLLRDGDTLLPVAQRGGNAQYAQWVLNRGPYRPVAGGDMARMLAEGRPVQVAGLMDSSEYRDRMPGAVALVELGGARSQVLVPMLKEGRVVGGITIYRPEVRPFTQKQIDLVSIFANQAVIAIENVRLFNETKEALERQTATAEILRVIASSPSDVQPVFDAIVETAKRLLGGFSASVARIVDGMVHLAAFTGIGESGETGERALKRLFPAPLSERYGIARAIETKAPFAIRDSETNPDVTVEWREMARQRGFRSVLYLPMLREGVSIGTINVTRREPGAFSDHQINLLRTFADQAVIAIENVRLFKELQARNAEITEALAQQTATADILKVISSSPTDTQPVFDAILKNAARLCEASMANLGLYDGEDYRWAAQRGVRAEYAKWLEDRKPWRPPVSSPVGRMIAERKPIDVEDVRDLSDYRDRNSARLVALVELGGARSSLVVPMLKEGQVIGGISIYRQDVRPFTQKQIDLVTTFTDQAVIAIENVRLFNEIQDKSRQLEVANKLKTEFLASMSHELRTPLNSVIGFSDLLLERMYGDLNARQENYIRNIQTSGKHLLSLINDILDLSKIEAGRMELDVAAVHVPSALQNAMMLVRERAERQSVALSCNVDPQIADIPADERKFKQIMLNLLSNAVKFTPQGGRVDVDARMLNGHLEVSVRDTGVGIAQENQQAVFEEFRQVGRSGSGAQEGTGLGLALARRFAELHGGTIRLESEPGKGSTFTVTLPLSRQA